MDYLDAHQIARLEALKLLLPRMPRNATPQELVVRAAALARFITDGDVPAGSEPA